MAAAAPARRARTATKGAAATRPAPATPRRKSGPAPRPKRVGAPPRTTTRPRTTARPRTATRPIARAAQGSAALVLDRLLRGRGWVGLVGVLLVGIVFLNVSVLELNRGIATTSARATALERSNSKLRARVGKLDSAERIQREAEARGFVLPQPGDVSYLKPHSSDAMRAAKQIEKPNGSTPGGTAAAATPTTTTTPSTSATSAPVTTATPSATPTTTTTTTAAAPSATAVTTAAPTAAASP